MQQLSARAEEMGRVVFFVPRWLEDTMSPSGLPYQAVPVLSSLTGNGFAVDLFTGVHDAPDGQAVSRALDGAVAAVAWCAELNPGVQIPGLLAFLAHAAHGAPDVPRLAGGGFFPLLVPKGFDLRPLAQAIVIDQEVDALSRQLLGVAERAAAREAFSVDAMWQLDLAPFLRPESMVFGNDQPSLQIPTALGCSKRCPFCFWEPTRWRALPAPRIVDLVAHVRQRLGVRQFLFGELDFLAGKKRVLDTARGLVDRGLDIRWFALGTVDDLLRLDDDELRLLVRSGCHALELGIEAGSERALRILGKRFAPRDALRAHDRLVAAGIQPVYNFVFGWPGETAADQRATRRLIERLHGTAPKVRFNFRLYQAIPGTTMGDAAFPQGRRLPRNLDELRVYRAAPGAEMPWLSPREVRRVRFLVDYVLPLAYDDALHDRCRTDRRRSLLARLARWRSQTGFLAWSVDRQMFERLGGAALPSTYLP